MLSANIKNLVRRQTEGANVINKSTNRWTKDRTSVVLVIWYYD